MLIILIVGEPTTITRVYHGHSRRGGEYTHEHILVQYTPNVDRNTNTKTVTQYRDCAVLQLALPVVNVLTFTGKRITCKTYYMNVSYCKLINCYIIIIYQ
jgi:hypothetical protein